MAFTPFVPTAGSFSTITTTGTITASGDVSVTAPAHFNGLGTPGPGVAAGANAGGTPPVPVLISGSTDPAGAVTFGTGTTPAAGDMVDVTYNAPFTATNGAHPVIAARNTATQALGLYVFASSATGFSVGCTNAPAASQANTVYWFTYHVIG